MATTKKTAKVTKKRPSKNVKKSPATEPKVSLTDAEALEIAKKLVPTHLHANARVVRHGGGPTSDRALAAGPNPSAPDDDMAELAKALGVKRAPTSGANDVDVHFNDATTFGHKPTIVQIRGGKVARVIKSG